MMTPVCVRACVSKHGAAPVQQCWPLDDQLSDYTLLLDIYCERKVPGTSDVGLTCPGERRACVVHFKKKKGEKMDDDDYGRRNCTGQV